MSIGAKNYFLHNIFVHEHTQLVMTPNFPRHFLYWILTLHLKYKRENNERYRVTLKQVLFTN